MKKSSQKVIRDVEIEDVDQIKKGEVQIFDIEQVSE